MSAFDRRERHTFMDGKVVTFSPEFKSVSSALGDYDKACGSFEISASRNAVMVHKADLSTASEVSAFLEAISAAGAVAADLSRKDRGSFRS